MTDRAKVPFLVPEAAARPEAVLGGHDGVDQDVSRRLPDFRAATEDTRTASIICYFTARKPGKIFL